MCSLRFLNGKINSVSLNTLTVVGEYFEKCAADFDFSPCNLNKIQKLIEHIGGIDCIDPHHMQSDSSIGAFMMYVIKDACDYAGLMPKKKEVPSR